MLFKESDSAHCFLIFEGWAFNSSVSLLVTVLFVVSLIEVNQIHTSLYHSNKSACIHYLELNCGSVSIN